jgi:hypothetical protein
MRRRPKIVGQIAKSVAKAERLAASEGSYRLYRGKWYPPACIGDKHMLGCDYWHPKCRARRIEAYGGPCYCTAYPYAHRPESGACRYSKITGDMPASLFSRLSPQDLEDLEAEYQRQKAEKRATMVRRSR